MLKKDRMWKLKKIVEFIRDTEYPNAKKLAEMFRNREGIEISEISIYRHIQYLRNVEHAPIEVDMNRVGSGYYLTDRDFWSDKLKLTSGELLGLGLMQSIMKVYKNTPLEKEMNSIFDKMKEFMPDGNRYDKSKIAQYIRVINDPMAVIDTAIFTQIINSVQDHKSIRFDYTKNGAMESQKYTINPYRILFCQNGDWYLMGCKTSDRTAIRTFAFSRMTNIETTGEIFTIPVDFRLESHIDPEMGIWKSDSFYRVKMVFDRQLAQHAEERKWHHTQRITRLEDGKVLVELTTTQLKDITRIILGYGSLVKVLEPPELVEDIRNELLKMKDVYGV